MSLEITKICRTCLALEGALLSIYDSKGTSGGGGCVADMLGDLTSIPPKPTDGMPEKVCLTCISEINRCYSFKMKCDNSDRTLRQLLNLTEDEVEDTHEEMKLKSEEVTPVELIEVKKKPQKRKTEMNYRILNDEVEAVTAGQSNEMYSMQAEEDLEASYFVIASEEDEHRRNEDKNEQQEEVNSDDYEDLLQKFVHQPNENEEDEGGEEDDDEEEQVQESEEYKPTRRRSKPRKKEELKCPVCPMTFVHPRNLTKHMHRHHNMSDEPQTKPEEQRDPEEQAESSQDQDPDEQFEMDIQPLESEMNVIEDTIHMKEVFVVQMNKHRCPRCGAGFAQQKSLNIHIKQNKCTEKQYSCGKCQKVFISQENLRAHIRTHKEEFTCSICGDVFSHEEELNEHKAEKHNLKMRNQCPHCKKVFTMLSTLKDHMRIHSGEKPFLCSVCGKGFSQNANLKQHVMRHNKTKPFKCDECPRSFVSKGELFSHVRSHTGDHPFICDICKTGFTTSSSLQKHKRIHTGERPYGCDFCPMRFTALNTLKNHRRTHTGEKPYKCQYCQRGFAQKSDCAIHVRTHTGERRYVCQICGSAFQQSGTLRTHMKTHRREKDNELQSQDEGEDGDQAAGATAANVVDLLDEVDLRERSKHGQKHKTVDLGDDDLLHLAIEECSSENNDFSGE